MCCFNNSLNRSAKQCDKGMGYVTPQILLGELRLKNCELTN